MRVPLAERVLWTSKGRYWLVVALILAVGTYLLWPALDAGMITDDYMEAAMLDGTFAAPRNPLDLFTFTSGRPGDLAAVQRLGSMPFCTHPEFKLSFFRPLSSAMVSLDRAVLGDNLPAYHLHSILWWIALCIVVARFYAHLLPASVALLSVTFFALSNAHHFAVMWLANRGGIVSMCLGIWGLHVLLFTRSPTRRSQWTAALLFSLSLLGGEWVFPLFGLAITYPLLGPGARPTLRTAKSLWPLLVPAALYLITRTALGYGAHGSGIYVDPLGEPLRFLQALAVRAPVLTADLLLGVPAHWWDTGSPWRDTLILTGLFSPQVWSKLPSWHSVQISIGVFAAVLFALGAHLVMRRLDSDARATLRSLLVAALLALIPVAGSFPSSRLGLPAWAFAAPAVAYALQRCLRAIVFPAGKTRKKRLLAAFLAYFIVRNLLLIGFKDDVAGISMFFRGINEWVLNAEIDDEKLPEQRVFILSGGDFTSTFFFPYVLSYAGRPIPLSCYSLLGTPKPVDVYRDSENSFLLRPLSGTLLESDAEIFFRDPRAVLTPGTRMVMPEMEVEVRKTWKRRPLELRFSFARSLDDPSYVFLRSEPLGFNQVEWPRVGQWKRLHQAAVPHLFGASRGAYERRIDPLPDMLLFDPQPDFLLYSEDCEGKYDDCDDNAEDDNDEGIF